MRHFALFISLIWFLGCYPSYQESFIDFLPSTVEIVDEPLCSSDESSPLYENKILFILDKTQSSRKSDPSNLRFKNINEFIETNEHLDLNYGVIYFRDKKTLSLFDQEGIPTFTKDIDLLKTQLIELEEIRDSGREDYDSILSSVEETLENDQENSSSSIPNYHIYYISDGSKYESQKEGEIRFLNGIFRMTEKWNNVKVHGVYYGNYKNRRPSAVQRVKNIGERVLEIGIATQMGIMPIGRSAESQESVDEPHDVQLLKNISLEGKGQFIDLNKEPELKIDSDVTDLLSVERFFIYNLNSAVCFDGHMDVDSDADGLCDRDEVQLEGFYPDKRFSFNDGYGDAFHWRALYERETLPPCSDRLDEDRDLLTSCEEKYLNLKFQNKEGMIPLREDHPDSDGDSLIDGIEFFIYLSELPQAALDPSNLEEVRFPREENDLGKILKHMSPFVTSYNQASFGAQIIPIADGKESCYGVRNGSFPLYPTLTVQELNNSLTHQEGQNILFIYALQKKGLSDSKIYQSGFKKVSQESSQLSLPKLQTRLL